MLSGPVVILVLKVAVIAVTVLLLAALVALGCGRRQLHGRINLVFFVLTMLAVVGLEVLIRLDAELHAYFWKHPEIRDPLVVHLCFSIPAAIILPFMLFTGATHRGKIHMGLSVLFSILWIGTFITGVFYLPHTPVG